MSTPVPTPNPPPDDPSRPEQRKGIVKRRFWTPEEDKLLGTCPDRVVAGLIGCRREMVHDRRRLLGIPACYERPPWTPEHLALVGRKPDEEVARLTGHSWSAVRQQRALLHRPNPAPLARCWTPEQDRQLGTLPDGQLAVLLGRSEHAIRGRRSKLKIKAVAATLTTQELAGKIPANLLRQIDEVLGGLKESDRTLLARRFGFTGQPPQSLVKIAQQEGVSRAYIWFRLNRILRFVCRQEDLTRLSLPDRVSSIAPRRITPLQGMPVLSPPHPPARLQYNPQLYVEVIARLAVGEEPTPAELRADRRLLKRRQREMTSATQSPTASGLCAPGSMPGAGADYLDYPPRRLGRFPGYISIPEPLKSKPIASLGRNLGMPRLARRIRVRLLRLLQFAGVQCLGDLDGKRLSDFAEFRGCGRKTLRALRQLISRALRSGAKPGPAAIAPSKPPAPTTSATPTPPSTPPAA